MGGLARKMPQTAIVFLVGTLSLAGVPLFAGFVSKEEVPRRGVDRRVRDPVLHAADRGRFLTAFYMFRVVFLAFFGDRGARREARGASVPAHREAHIAHPASHIAHREPHDAPALMTLPLWVLAIIAMGIGIYFTRHAPHAQFEAPGWLTPAAIGVALSGILLAWLTYQRRIVSADALASVFLADPARRARRVLARRHLRRHLPLRPCWPSRGSSAGIDRISSTASLTSSARGPSTAAMGCADPTGKVQDYVFAVGFGLLALIAWIGVGW
jgi:NADH:ubiquinone oxidoreductase subunit 5 (subunit L)/multisubunit Na+/H+ antiporter MnhA subunit